MFYLRVISAALFISVGLTACAVPFSYSADPLEARIIDSDTKQPIAGAVVVATWILVGGVHPGRSEALVVREAVTDAGGKFQIPAWGPMSRPASGALDILDPEMVIVKSGYLLGVANNYEDGSPAKRLDLQVRNSLWNKKDIELKRSTGNKSEYSNRFTQIFARLHVVYDSADCKWKQVPNAVRAFEVERKYQVSLGDKFSMVPPFERLISKRSCQPVDQFLKAYHAGE